MNVQQKARFEQQAVIGLLAVFAVTFLLGPAKNMKLFQGSNRRAQSAAASKSTMPSLPSLIQQHNDAVSAQVEPNVAIANVPQAEVQTTYSAQTLRDPLKSLLPAAPKKAIGAQVQSNGAKRPASLKAAPPPALTVQGLVWGGQPKAIIDEQLYGVGEFVQGAQILAIDRSGVTIDHQGMTVVYTMATMPTQVRGSRRPVRGRR